VNNLEEGFTTENYYFQLEINLPGCFSWL